jgi:uncharacterized protein YybS (DUF2232 family)
MSRGPGKRRGAGVWTIVQVAGIVIWIAGFVVAFYFLSFTKKSQTALQNNGQVAGLILTALAYLLIIYSMIKHSPDSRSSQTTELPGAKREGE